MAEAGDSGAQAARRLIKESGSFLSTVQIGITLVGVATGAFGGSALAIHISPLIATIPGIGEYAEAISVVLMVILITYLATCNW